MFQWQWRAQDQQVVEASSLMLVELEVEQLAELLVELQVLFQVYFYILIHIFSKLCFKVWSPPVQGLPDHWQEPYQAADLQVPRHGQSQRQHQPLPGVRPVLMTSPCWRRTLSLRRDAGTSSPTWSGACGPPGRWPRSMWTRRSMWGPRSESWWSTVSS